ncbi:unnamed protein product [Acanthoscelides obtectus]|uniref:MADF domain-containing protein n=1 Tax=Acanthoscelides obtectus TaxID=200917 RepID=A0A9P0MKK0_ACAOB|nr:unnamed protein product [Acanthoscelides obtectus]CAK1641442.1 hypothetical protein AOBTE_LOCUS12408 [Acanthoscelides obtectus]
MSSFRTCLNKVKESSKSRAGASDIYRPTWFAFEIMSRFLRNKDEPKKTINSEDILSQLDEESSEGDKPEQIQDDVTDATNGSENVGTILSKSSPQSVFKVPSKKKMRGSLAADEALHTQMQEAYSILKKKNNKDDCDLYCEFLAVKLRKMDERKHDIVMNQIDNIVFRTKMGYSQYQYTCCSGNEHPPAPQTHVVPQPTDVRCSQPYSLSHSQISSSPVSDVSHSYHSEPELRSINTVTDDVNSLQSNEDITIATFLTTFQ